MKVVSSRNGKCSSLDKFTLSAGLKTNDYLWYIVSITSLTYLAIIQRYLDAAALLVHPLPEGYVAIGGFVIMYNLVIIGVDSSGFYEIASKVANPATLDFY